jgi:hypothetical protein
VVRNMPQQSNYNIISSSLENPILDSLNFVELQPVEQDTLLLNWGDYNSGFYSGINPDSLLGPLPFQQKTEFSNSTLFVVYIAVLLLWSFYYQKNKKGLMIIGKTFTSNNVLFQEINDKSGNNGFVSLGMFFSGVTVISIFIYQLISHISLPLFLIDLYNSNGTIILFGFGILLYLLFKTIIILLSAFIFKSSNTFTTYLALNVNSIQLIGVLLYPIIILVSYGYSLNSLWVVRFGVFILSGSFLYRIVRVFFLGVKQTNSQVFHIILYICALEILPILVISRLLLTK